MSERVSRQSFLGATSDEVLRTTTVGLVGLCGGGSHIAQQSAHVGVGRYRLFDPQRIEGTNLNRLVGATALDVDQQTLKTDIVKRLILSIRPRADVRAYPTLWQSAGDALRECDVIFGCVDSFAARNELERQARRYLTPYIDIGMDVHSDGAAFAISGQVFLSLPGGPCLRCAGILTDARLAQEAADYGAAGSRQQVVWPNGVLASTAIGLFMRVVTPWTTSAPAPLLEYDGNRGTVAVSHKVLFLPAVCPHFGGDHDLGDPFFDGRAGKNLQKGYER